MIFPALIDFSVEGTASLFSFRCPKPKENGSVLKAQLERFMVSLTLGVSVASTAESC